MKIKGVDYIKKGPLTNSRAIIDATRPFAR
jgi:hypothetical protein